MPPLYPVIMPVPDGDRALTGRPKVIRLSRLARIALAHSCRISGLHLDDFPKDADGVPQPVGGVHWSISHKGDVVGGVAAPQPVGFDLETVRPVSDALLAKVAGAAEWRLAAGDPQRTFFRFWTAKEAVLKAEGKGFAGLSRCRVAEIADDTHMLLTYAGRQWPVSHLWFDGHVAALTSCGLAVSWRIVATPG